jgi:acetyl esterase/lipase
MSLKDIHVADGFPGKRRRFMSGDGLVGMAPALVAAELTRLCDEAACYARKLAAVSTLVEYREVRGVDHGYDLISDAPKAANVTRWMYAFFAHPVADATAPGRP